MANPPSVLIAHTSTSSGERHVVAALERAFRRSGHDLAVETVDLADHCPPWAVRLARAYLPDTLPGRIARTAIGALARPAASFFAHVLVERQPDIVVGTHPLAVSVAARLAARRRIRSTVVSAPTDFAPRVPLASRGLSRVCVASTVHRDRLVAHGYPEDAVALTGVPIRAQFAVEYDREAARAHFGLPTDARVILALVAAGRAPERARARAALVLSLPALASLPDTAVAVVTTHDPELAREVTSRASGFGAHNVHLFSDVEHMAPLMASADLIVARPSGVVCAEALAVGVPLVLVAPESRAELATARLLERLGAAVFVSDPSMLSQRLGRTLGSREALERMRRAAAGLARPAAAAEVAARALAAAGLGEPDLPEAAS